MNNKTNLLILSSLIGGSTLYVEAKQPNIIVFLVDDLGWNDTSIPLSGEKTKYNERYKTPNLEKLAQEGVVMTNAHAQALSVPSRASLITGQSSIRHGVTGDYVPTISHDESFEIEAGHQLDHRIALPKQLKRVGYKTIHAGKYHLCEYESKTPSISDVGFDVNIAGSMYGQPGSFQPEANFTNENILKVEGKNIMVGLEEYFGSEKHLTEALTAAAIKEMGTAVKEEKPFFLYLSHFTVHTPIEPHKKHMDLYELNEGERSEEAEYGSMITGMDESVGEVVAELERLGIADNTMLLFFSDNGGRILWRGKESLHGPYRFNYPLRSGKASIYEGGIRVPAIAYWPAKFKQGIRTDAPVMIEDIYSTVISTAGAHIPSSHIVDGKDLTPIFTTGKTPSYIAKRNMYFYLPYRFDGQQMNGPEFVNGGITPSSAVIKENWKLIYIHKDQSFELYNLAHDLSETTNLIDVNRKMASSLVEELDAFLRGNSAVNSIKLPERTPTPWPLDAYTEKYGS